MKKSLLIVLFVLLITACVGLKRCSDNIVMYMQDHPYDGQVKTDSVQNAQYYRILINDLGGEKYLVQDFFKSGKKFTDPYTLIDGQLEYVMNEENYLKSKPIEGKKVIWYDSGSKYKEINYRDHWENGIAFYWHDNGQKASEKTYVQGKEHGLTRTWDTDGNKSMECNYDMGEKHRACNSWFDNGKKYKERYFDHDKPVGVWKTWMPDGSLIEEIDYSKGV